MTTRVLGPYDLHLYRHLRLEALASDPAAFCSTHERESAFDDATWMQRLTSYEGRPAAVVVDDVAIPSGMVGVGVEANGTTAGLYGMWVRPAGRRTGIAARLIEGTVAWAVAHGVDRLELWVVVGNAGAIALYERCGFVATGSMDVVPGRPGVAEVQMRRRLG